MLGDCGGSLCIAGDFRVIGDFIRRPVKLNLTLAALCIQPIPNSLTGFFQRIIRRLAELVLRVFNLCFGRAALPHGGDQPLFGNLGAAGGGRVIVEFARLFEEELAARQARISGRRDAHTLGCQRAGSGSSLRVAVDIGAHRFLDGINGAVGQRQI